jgi:hypothetical protein
MLLVCVPSYLKSVLLYTFFKALDTHHPDTLYLLGQGCEDPWLFFEASKGPRTKMFEKTLGYPKRHILKAEFLHRNEISAVCQRLQEIRGIRVT